MELLMNSFQIILLGQNLMGNCLSLDRSIKPNDMLYPKRLTLYDEIYIGHTVTRIGKTEPVQMACVWNVDTGAAFKPLTIMDVNTKEFWQSEPLNFVF
jgi:serine/threonine protein phosphatase 1